jgi:diguanylate cyclase (GGDEF)-like protein
MMTTQQDLEIVSLFRGVEIESIQHLLEDCPVETLKPGQLLLRSGSPNHVIYALLSGRLRIHLDLLLDPIAVLEPGEIVGELSVIDGQPTSAHVFADEECRVLVLDEKTTWSLMQSSHGVAYNLLLVLAQRLRGGNSVISTSRELQREYEQYAIVDALTGLYNRRWLDNRLPTEMKQCRNNHQNFSLLIIDINKFKPYNDTYGHLAGDHVLYTVARTLLRNSRSGEMIARYGGDEFVVLLSEADAITAEEVGVRLREAVGKARLGTSDWRDLPAVSISVGSAEMTSEDTPQTLIAKADASLYRAKELRDKETPPVSTD